MHLTRKATHRRHIHKATCILYIRTRWREVVIFMPLPFKPQEKRPGTKWRRGSVIYRASLGLLVKEILIQLPLYLEILIITILTHKMNNTNVLITHAGWIKLLAFPLLFWVLGSKLSWAENLPRLTQFSKTISTLHLAAIWKRPKLWQLHNQKSKRNCSHSFKTILDRSTGYKNRHLYEHNNVMYFK